MERAVFNPVDGVVDGFLDGYGCVQGYYVQAAWVR